MRELDWHLLREVEQLFERLQLLLEGPSLAPSSLADTRLLAPAVDVYETPDTVIVEAELPGIGPDQVRVELAGQTLLISGERMDCQQGTTTQLLRIERPQGRFARLVPLPVPVAPPEEATLRRGVLAVRLPKAIPQARTIPVGGEDQ